MQNIYSPFPNPASRTQNKKGVTLVEMATVLSVLLIITAFAVPEFTNMVERGRRQNAIDGASNLSEALEMYKAEWVAYPLQGDIFPLADYEEITRYYSSFDMNQYATLTPAIKGISIYTGLAGTACVVGVVSKITPTYKVTHCAKTDNTWNQTKDIQPTCCWTKGGVDCNNAANFYPCRDKM